MDKSSAYGAKGPGFNSRWRQEFIVIKIVLYVLFIRENKAPIGANLKKKKKKKILRQVFGFIFFEAQL